MAWKRDGSETGCVTSRRLSLMKRCLISGAQRPCADGCYSAGHTSQISELSDPAAGSSVIALSPGVWNNLTRLGRSKRTKEASFSTPYRLHRCSIVPHLFVFFFASTLPLFLICTSSWFLLYSHYSNIFHSDPNFPSILSVSRLILPRSALINLHSPSRFASTCSPAHLEVF